LTELTIGQLIKIILGIFVFVAVILGVYLFFTGNVIPFFDNLVGNGSTEDQAQNSNVASNNINKKSCGDCGAGWNNLCGGKECLSLGDCEYSMLKRWKPCTEIK